MSEAQVTRLPRSAAPPAETVAQRVQRLQREARQLAREHLAALAAQIVAVEEMAAEIAEGGDVYPVGARELCRRLVEDMESRVSTLEAIVARS